MMSNDFAPDWAVPPRETIAEILRLRGLSAQQFGTLLSDEYLANQLLDGSPIADGVAEKLSLVLGATPRFWLEREQLFRNRNRVIEKEWLRRVPRKEMVKRGWISHSDAAACLAYFGVNSVVDWRSRYVSSWQVSYRTSQVFESSPESVVTWLRYGQLVADKRNCSAWNRESFIQSLSEIRRLTTQKLQNFLPELVRLCADSGVAIVVARSISGCRASGATLFLNPNKALILLSFRYLSDDHFWFTFFHEAGHLILHSGAKTLFMDELEPSFFAKEHLVDEEHEANVFAEQQLLPEKFMSEMKVLPSDAKSVIRFAHRVGVCPGIVVGQMQHFELVGRNFLNQLKRRYSWAEIDKVNQPLNCL